MKVFIFWILYVNKYLPSIFSLEPCISLSFDDNQGYCKGPGLIIFFSENSVTENFESYQSLHNFCNIKMKISISKHYLLNWSIEDETLTYRELTARIQNLLLLLESSKSQGFKSDWSTYDLCLKPCNTQCFYREGHAYMIKNHMVCLLSPTTKFSWF